MRGVFGGWVSCMVLLSRWREGPAWYDGARGRQARACRGLYKLCLKRMQKVLLPVCKIETGVCRLSSGLLLLCRCSGVGCPALGRQVGGGGQRGPRLGCRSLRPPLLLLPSLTHLPDQEIVGCGSSGSQGQSDRDTGEGYGGSSAAA